MSKYSVATHKLEQHAHTDIRNASVCRYVCLTKTSLFAAVLKVNPRRPQPNTQLTRASFPEYTGKTINKYIYIYIYIFLHMQPASGPCVFLAKGMQASQEKARGEQPPKDNIKNVGNHRPEFDGLLNCPF